MMNLGRHGDLSFHPVEALPEGEQAPLARSQRGLVLAEGETTGHAHRILTEEVEVMRIGTQMFVVAPTEWQVLHEEHQTLTFPPGTWEVINEREWSDEDEPRRVID